MPELASIIATQCRTAGHTAYSHRAFLFFLYIINSSSRSGYEMCTIPTSWKRRLVALQCGPAECMPSNVSGYRHRQALIDASNLCMDHYCHYTTNAQHVVGHLVHNEYIFGDFSGYFYNNIILNSRLKIL